jgi:lipoic acid synthetase
LKQRIPAGPAAARVRDILKDLHLGTVCGSALCPNAAECFHSGTATFLIMGPQCTRGCSFCAVGRGAPSPIEADEPARVAEAAKLLGLKYVVITSVTRDDLADGGASHFAATIDAVKSATPDASVEVLVPDFAGRPESIATVVAAAPAVFNHNVETVPRLYPHVRPQADYRRSLEVLRLARELAPGLTTKSGIMVGLGETILEVEGVFSDLRAAGVGIVTVGQYLRPSKNHLPIERFVTPEEFEGLTRTALSMGFSAAFCGPLVRSSYHAGEVFASGRAR